MAETAIDRASRALDLVPYILAHEGISLEELAQEFDSSVVGITKDLNLLFVCGLPGYTPLELIDLSFEDGIVTILDPQVLNAPRKFTSHEITSLLLSLELLCGTHPADSVIGARILDLQRRLAALLKSENAKVVTMPNRYSPEMIANVNLVHEAIREGAAIRCNYISASSDTLGRREIIPRMISALDEHLYLMGYSIDKGEDRTYRLDRISNLEKFSPGDLAILEPRPVNVFKVLLEVSPLAINFIESHSTIIEDREATPAGNLIRVAVADTEWILREVMKYAGEIRILEPANLTKELSERAQKALSLY